MKIGIISDTHGRQLTLRKAINTLHDVDLIFHLGDLVTDATYIKNTEDIPIVYVAGNCDYPADVDVNIVYTLDGYEIFLTHGHLYDVKFGYEKLAYKAKELDVDIVLFGHTHIPEIFKYDDILFINPGSLGLPPNGYKSTYAILETGNGKVEARLGNISG